LKISPISEYLLNGKHAGKTFVRYAKFGKNLEQMKSDIIEN
jgi:hypothetical protein